MVAARLPRARVVCDRFQSVSKCGFRRISRTKCTGTFGNHLNFIGQSSTGSGLRQNDAPVWQLFPAPVICAPKIGMTME